MRDRRHERKDSRLSSILPELGTLSFWSYVCAAAGIIGVIAGVTFYLTIPQIENFSLSVLIIGLSLLFLALAFSARSVGAFMLGRQGRYGANILIMSAAFLVIAILVNFLLFRNTLRVDATSTRIFTLSPQAVSVLDSLEGPVQATLFYDPSSPREQFQAEQTSDLLNELSRRTNKLTYRLEDPDLNPSLASRYGVVTYPSLVFEDLTNNRLQELRCIPGPECRNYSEQELIASILLVTGQEQKRVYFLTGHKEKGLSVETTSVQLGDEGYDLAIGGMRRDNYAVGFLNLLETGKIPEDTAVLVVAGPQQDLTADEKQAIFEYLKRGVVRKDGTVTGARLLGLFDPETPESFADLLTNWGIDLGYYPIADIFSSVAEEPLTPIVQRSNQQYISREGVPITEQLNTNIFPGATAVDITVSDPVDVPSYIDLYRMIVSTPSWMETDPEEVQFNPDEEQMSVWSYATVVQALGTFTEEPADLGNPPPAKFVIFGDSDFAKNRFYASFDNADLLLNSVNWLAEDYNLISIRPKIIPFRELVVTTGERDFIKWSSWFLPPAVMVLVGFYVWWRRR